MPERFSDYQGYLRKLNNKIPFDSPLVAWPDHNDGANVHVKNLTISELVCVFGPEKAVRVIDTKYGGARLIKKSLISLAKDWHRQGNERECESYSELSLIGTCLEDKIGEPLLVKRLSLVHQFWPQPIRISHAQPKIDSLVPPQNKICILQQKDSHLECQMSPGGSSVWFHMISGHQTYELFEPTKRNLVEYKLYKGSHRGASNQDNHIDCQEKQSNLPHLYHNINDSDSDSDYDNQEGSASFEIGTKVSLALETGMLLIIPTGWIYNVKAIEDSTLVGGRFLHYKDIEFQLECHEIEQERLDFESYYCDIPRCYGFPSLSLVYWYTVLAINRTNRRTFPSPAYQENFSLHNARSWVVLKSFRYPKFPLNRLLMHLENWLTLHHHCRDSRRNMYAPDGFELGKILDRLKSFKDIQ